MTNANTLKKTLCDGHDAREIANKFIIIGLETNEYVEPLKILKLVYFAHGWMLGLYGQPLSAQPIVAGEYGPTIPCVFEMLQGHAKIKKRFHAFDYQTEFTDQEKDLMNQVYTVYLKYTGVDLATHARNGSSGALWREFYKEENPESLWEKIIQMRKCSNEIIPNSAIAECFPKTNPKEDEEEKEFAL